MSDPPPLRIGDLARATGLTVRTLHHYDRIGLLRPVRRSEAGHRLYGAEDVARLYRIVALRGLGLPLDRAGELLASDDDPRPVVLDHLRLVQERLRAGQRLRDRLTTVAQALERHEAPSTATLLHLIQETTMHEKTIRDAYGAEQLEWLAARRAALGDEAITAVEAEWPELYRRAQAELDAGTDPADPRVAAIVARMDELVEAFTGGRADVRASLQRLHAEHGEELRAAHGGPSPELAAYLDRGRAARRRAEEGPSSA